MGTQWCNMDTQWCKDCPYSDQGQPDFEEENSKCNTCSAPFDPTPTD